jgi:metal-responsive CopG/Arc/MetJ family transcriptional regulator
MTGTCLTITLSVVLDETELDALEGLRLRRRLSSQAETIRELIQCALREEAWEAFDIVGPR